MKALRLVLLGIALAVFAGIGWRVSHPNGWTLSRPAEVASSSTPAPTVAPPSAPAAPDPAAARAEVLSRLADAPEYAPFFDRYRTEFASDYVALIDASAEAVAKGGRAPNPDKLMTDAVRSLRQSKGVLASQAEDGPLSGIFEAQAAIVDALAPNDPGLCVDFLYGGVTPSFMAFAATHRDLVERLAIANLSAIASGQQNHIERAQPTSEDFDALTATLKAKNLSDDEIAALLDGKTFDPPLPEARMCEAGRIYLHALQDLPHAVRMRVYALSAALPARS